MPIDPTLLQLVELASASPLSAFAAAVALLWAPAKRWLSDYSIKVQAELVRSKAAEELANSVAKQANALAKHAEALKDIRNRVGCYYMTPPQPTAWGKRSKGGSKP